MATGTINNVLAYAEAQLGQPYLWGGEGAGGFDCSGLTQAAYKAAGVALPRTAQQQYAAVTHVGTPAVGDLVFYGTSASDVEHVGIYLGNGKMLDAPHTGAKVRIENVWSGVLGYGRPLAGASNVDPALASVASAGGAQTVAAGSAAAQTVDLKGTVTSGLTRLTVEAVIVLGGVALVCLGAWKGTTAGRSASEQVSKQKQKVSDVAGQVQGAGGAPGAKGGAGSAGAAPEGGALAELPELAGMAALA
jgi:hypothetical protein